VEKCLVVFFRILPRVPGFAGISLRLEGGSDFALKGREKIAQGKG
jgi:hypothetical protein